MPVVTSESDVLEPLNFYPKQMCVVLDAAYVVLKRVLCTV